MARGLIDGVARDIVIGPITPERATKKIGIVAAQPSRGVGP